MLGLDLVHLVVARDEADDGPAVAVDERERLARARLGYGEEGGEVGDRAALGSLDLLEVARLAFDEVDGGGGSLGVGREAARVAEDELGLARVGERHELDGGVPADLAGVGHDRQSPETDAAAEVGVGLLLEVVALLQGLLRGREGIGVLHDELAAAHEPEAGPALVAELVLDVVEHDGQLPVGAELVGDEVGVGLLVGRAQRVLVFVPVLDAHELRTVDVPAPALAPEVGVGQDRRHHLLAVDPLHLVADDGLDLLDGTPRERQVRIEAGGTSTYHPRPEQELMAGELGLYRVLLERGGVELGHLHVLSQRESFLGHGRTNRILRQAHVGSVTRSAARSRQRARRRVDPPRPFGRARLRRRSRPVLGRWRFRCPHPGPRRDR